MSISPREDSSIARKLTNLVTNIKTFYFVMIDEEDSTEEDVKLNAITIDTNKKVSIIEDFTIFRIFSQGGLWPPL